jgi:trehalose 6-phosphate phosphatase
MEAWQKIVKQFRDAAHILLLSDYDGTLTPIVDKPEMANLAERTRQLIRDLSRQPRFTVGIVSGRALFDLRDRVGVSGIIYAGNHGLEIEGPGISFVNPVAEDFKPILHVIHYVLSKTLETVRGVFVENKGLSLSVHYRLAEEHRSQEVEKIVKSVVEDAEAKGLARTTSGKKVYEVRPAVSWDKGQAVNLLTKRYGSQREKDALLPIYLGDDLADEDGFRIVDTYTKGVSVFVGEESGSSAARYFLKSPAEVMEFLEMLLQQAQKSFK